MKITSLHTSTGLMGLTFTLLSATALAAPVLPVNSAIGFAESIGVVTHLHYTDGEYANYKAVIADLQYLGINLVREGIPNKQTPGYGGYSFDPVANAGIRFNMGLADPDVAADMTRLTTFMKAHPGAVVSLEGRNEVDGWPVTYKGRTGLPAAVDLQTDQFKAVKANPLTSSLKMSSLTFSTGWSGYTYTIGKLDKVVDVGAAHQYFNNGDQASKTNFRDPVFNFQKYVTPGKDMIVTETGWHTGIGSSWTGVDEATQARLLTNELFFAANNNIKQVFIYQLLDAYKDTPAAANAEKHFGLFSLGHKPKVAATAIRNTLAILRTNAKPVTALEPLDISIEGMPATGSFTVLQKAPGVFVVAATNAGDIWNQATHKRIGLADIKVKLKLGKKAAKITYYIPFWGTGANRSVSNVSEDTFLLTDMVKLIEIRMQ